jgi:hypothetical protein
MSSKALMVSAAHWLVRRHSLDATHIFDGINHFWRGVYGSSTIDTVEDKEENFKAFFKGDPARIMRSAPLGTSSGRRSSRSPESPLSPWGFQALRQPGSRPASGLRRVAIVTYFMYICGGRGQRNIGSYTQAAVIVAVV